MGNLTESVVVVDVEYKAALKAFIRANFLKESPYIYDLDGNYPTYEFEKWAKEKPFRANISYSERRGKFIIKTTHKNSAPADYIQFVKMLGGWFLFRDLDGYGSDYVWDLTNENRMSSYIDSRMFYIFSRTLDHEKPFKPFTAMELGFYSLVPQRN